MPRQIAASPSSPSVASTPPQTPQGLAVSSLPSSRSSAAACSPQAGGGGGGGADDAAPPRRADEYVLPANGSLYYDFLLTFPLGPLEVDLPKPKEDDELFEDPEEALVAPDFVLEKVAPDEWRDLPGYAGAVSTACLFEYISKRMRGQETIVITHGKDPRKVKRELHALLPAGPRFISIPTIIDLDNEHEVAVGGGAEKLCSASGVELFEKVALTQPHSASLPHPPLPRCHISGCHGPGGAVDGSPSSF